MGHRRLLLVACLTALAAAPDAWAELRVPRGGDVVSASPSGLLAVQYGPPWARPDRPRVTFTRPNGRTEPLRQFDRLLSAAARKRSGEYFEEDVAFRADASRGWNVVTLSRSRYGYEEAFTQVTVLGSEIQAARRRGPARTVARCVGDDLFPELHGSTIAYLDCGGQAVVVADLDRPESPPLRIVLPPGTGERVPVIGDGHVALTLAPRPAAGGPPGAGPPPASLVVYEIAGGRPVTRVEGLRVSDVALGADGTAVVAEAPDGAACPSPFELLVIPPGGRPRPIGPVSCVGELSVAGSTVIARATGPVATLTDGWNVRDLIGGPSRPLVDHRFRPSFADDSGLVQLEAPACESLGRYEFLALGTLLARGPGSIAPCTLRFETRTARVDRRGRFRVRYGCPAGCRGPVGVRVHATGRALPLSLPLQVIVPPGHPATARARLAPRALALLRRRGRLAVDLRATIPQAASLDGRSRRRHFHRRITLRAP